MHVGIVGTGNMGFPIASNVLKAGHQLTVFDIHLEATATLEKLGARRATDLPSLASAVDVTLTSLPNDAVVEEVMFGSEEMLGLIAGARSGLTVFDLSTVSPDTTCRLADRAAECGVRLIDAPVSGKPSGAAAGTLTVMIGASAEDVAPYEIVLRSFSKHLFFLGETGRGNILKLLNNYAALTNQAAVCEVMALADCLGIDRQTVGDVITRATGTSFILEHKLSALIAHNYQAHFFLDLALKDLGLALDLAERTSARTAVGRQAWELYAEASRAGLGHLDSVGLVSVLESSRESGLN